MIFFDSYHYPVEQHGDGGDSSMRAGMLCTFVPSKFEIPIKTFEIEPGLLCRHPLQEVAGHNSPWNFTRDQMIPLTAGLYMKGEYATVKRVLLRTLARLCFAQNFERDLPGTTKYPWPHSFIDDKGVPTSSSFDFADPLLPHHIGHLILCSKFYWLYPFLIFSYPLLFLSVVFNNSDLDNEQNQLQAMVKRAGAGWVLLYKVFATNWLAQTKHYWQKRDEDEYAEIIIENL